MLNIINILVILALFPIEFIKKPKIFTQKYKFSLKPIIVIFVPPIILHYLYDGSSWYFKPLLNGDYLLIYCWLELPLFLAIFSYPFYKLVLINIISEGPKKYIRHLISKLHWKIIIGIKEFAYGLAFLGLYALLLIILESALIRDEILTAPDESFRNQLLELADSGILSLLFFLDDVLLFPIAEELFFRGYCYNAFRERIGFNKALLLSATIFSLYHQSFFGIIPYFIMGIMTARGYSKTHSLVTPFVTHALYNLIFSYIII